jgi:hypothetical protein
LNHTIIAVDRIIYEKWEPCEGLNTHLARRSYKSLWIGELHVIVQPSQGLDIALIAIIVVEYHFSSIIDREGIQHGEEQDLHT